MIKEFLYQQLDDEEAGLTACLVIHTVNKPQEKVQQCVETLFRYLDNIVQNPDEEKYRKIRINNKVYQERVAPLEGVKQFLHAAGFELKQAPVPNSPDEMEECWFYTSTAPGHIEFLTVSRLRLFYKRKTHRQYFSKICRVCAMDWSVLNQSDRNWIAVCKFCCLPRPPSALNCLQISFGSRPKKLSGSSSKRRRPSNET